MSNPFHDERGRFASAGGRQSDARGKDKETSTSAPGFRPQSLGPTRAAAIVQLTRAGVPFQSGASREELGRLVGGVRAGREREGRELIRRMEEEQRSGIGRRIRGRRGR